VLVAHSLIFAGSFRSYFDVVETAPEHVVAVADVVVAAVEFVTSIVLYYSHLPALQ